MKFPKSTVLLQVLTAATLTMNGANAQVLPLGATANNDGFAQASGESLPLLVQAQYRRDRGHPGPGRYQRRGDRGDDTGAAVAAGIFGLILGGIIASEAQRQQEAVGYCAQRFRSYDPQSMTYLGYDGLRHPCP